MRRGTGFDLAVLALYVAAAAFVTFRFWIEPELRLPPMYPSDVAQTEWFLAHAARAVARFENPLFAMRLNVPEGVNVMANTSILALGLPFAPVTLAFGAAVTRSILLPLALAGTAFAWYLTLSRSFSTSRAAAAIGGWFCGFAPALVSHVSWHPNIAFQLLVPFLIARGLRLREPGRAVRNGVAVALLVAAQTFVNEEILLFTALACGIFVSSWAAQRPREAARVAAPFAAGVGVAALVTGAFLAAPLAFQFFGPRHYHGLDPGGQLYVNDITSFVSFATESLAGSGRFTEPAPLAPNHAEENAFFGAPLAATVVAAAVLLRASAIARALVAVGVVFAVLSFGAELELRGRPIGIPGPWAWLGRLPILDAVVPTRFGLVSTAVVGMLLALATDRVRELAAGDHRPAVLRALGLLALAIALIPAAPTPLDAIARSPIPIFFRDGMWRSWVGEGETAVPVPFPTPEEAEGMRWAAATGTELAIPGGYFLFPEGGIDGRVGVQGAPLRPTARLLREVGRGRRHAVGDADRVAAVRDLRAWRAAIVVLPAAEPRAAALRVVLEQLLGPPERQADVWLWDVRGNGAGT